MGAGWETRGDGGCVRVHRILVSRELEIDTARRTVRKNKALVPAAPKVFQLIELLVFNRDSVVERERIVRELWPDTHVSSSSLRWLLKEVRHAIGDDGVRQRYIATSRGYGLRWVAPVALRAPDLDCTQLIRSAESSLNAGRLDEARDALLRAAEMLEPNEAS